MLTLGLAYVATAQAPSPPGTQARTLFLQAKAAHDGVGQPQDFTKARTLYIQAAELGSDEALINLGYLYFTGQGVKTDMRKARSYYQLAADKGSRDAQRNLNMMDARGLGLAPAAKNAPEIESLKAKPSETPAQIGTQDLPLPQVRELSTYQPPSVFGDIEISEVNTASVINRTPVSKPEIQSPPTPEVEVEVEAAETPQARAKTYSTQKITMMGLLALLAMITAAYLLKRQKAKRYARAKALFKDYFYEAKRSDLRLTYLRRRNNNFVEATFYRQWHTTLSVLMARFALDYEGSEDNLKSFCANLNNELKIGRSPTRHLASEMSDSLMAATKSEIKAVDAYHMSNPTPLEPIASDPTVGKNPSFGPSENIVSIFSAKNAPS